MTKSSTRRPTRLRRPSKRLSPDPLSAPRPDQLIAPSSSSSEFKFEPCALVDLSFNLPKTPLSEPVSQRGSARAARQPSDAPTLDVASVLALIAGGPKFLLRIDKRIVLISPVDLASNSCEFFGYVATRTVGIMVKRGWLRHDDGLYVVTSQALDAGRSHLTHPSLITSPTSKTDTPSQLS